MRPIFTLVVAAAAATLSVGACSSDSGGGSAGSDSAGAAGSDSAGAPGSDSVQCQGDYAALTQAELEAKISSAGKCAGDGVAVCSNDVTVTAEQCGSDCFKNADPDGATQDKCVSTCISGLLNPSLSAGCLSCYIADVGCARDHCLLDCGIHPTSSECLGCRVAHGCAPTFFSCSGLPDQVGAAGGAGNAPGAGGAAGADAIPVAGAAGT
jgi:hypothetical protein